MILLVEIGVQSLEISNSLVAFGDSLQLQELVVTYGVPKGEAKYKYRLLVLIDVLFGKL